MSVKYWCHDTPAKVCAKSNLNNYTFININFCMKIRNPTARKIAAANIAPIDSVTVPLVVAKIMIPFSFEQFVLHGGMPQRDWGATHETSWVHVSPLLTNDLLSCTLSKATFNHFNAFVLDSFYWSVNRTAICFTMDPLIQPKYHVHPLPYM